jgi:ribonuclease T2
MGLSDPMPAVPSIAALLAALVLLASPGSTFAEPIERKGSTPGRFDFYVAALSWSPGFCELSGRRNKEQCGPEAPEAGFVLHGLWPQFSSGYPTECAPGQSPTRQAVADAVPPYPTEGLARYQWRKHGSCSGLDPSAYFRAAKQAFARIRIPDELAAAKEDMMRRPNEIERLFSASNPGLRSTMMSVQCRRGVFQEVRICLSKELGTFTECLEVDRDSCRGGSAIRIEAIGN